MKPCFHWKKLLKENLKLIITYFMPYKKREGENDNCNRFPQPRYQNLKCTQSKDRKWHWSIWIEVKTRWKQLCSTYNTKEKIELASSVMSTKHSKNGELQLLEQNSSSISHKESPAKEKSQSTFCQITCMDCIVINKGTMCVLLTLDLWNKLYCYTISNIQSRLTLACRALAISSPFGIST